MGEVPPLNILDRASVSSAREWVRDCARAVGLGDIDTERMALAVSELAQNQLDHARQVHARYGTILCREIARNGVGGIEIVAADEGPGLTDPASAIAGLLPGKGLGIGLAGVRRAVDELDMDVRLGESTALTIRKFAAAVRRHPEVAIIGQGIELPSGDSAVVTRRGDTVWLSVIDGCGHGILARHAADRALTAFASQIDRDCDIETILADLHTALARTRGAAATLVRWEVSSGSLVIGGVGNVTSRLYESNAAPHSIIPTAGMLGTHWVTQPRIHRLAVAPRSVLLLATDGIATRLDVVPSLVGRAAAHIASQVFTTCRKGHDDALVLVAR